MKELAAEDAAKKRGLVSKLMRFFSSNPGR
jgi:hypothetical protein